MFLSPKFFGPPLNLAESDVAMILGGIMFEIDSKTTSRRGTSDRKEIPPPDPDFKLRRDRFPRSESLLRKTKIAHAVPAIEELVLRSRGIGSLGLILLRRRDGDEKYVIDIRRRFVRGSLPEHLFRDGHCEHLVLQSRKPAGHFPSVPLEL